MTVAGHRWIRSDESQWSCADLLTVTLNGLSSFSSCIRSDELQWSRTDLLTITLNGLSTFSSCRMNTKCYCVRTKCDKRIRFGSPECCRTAAAIPTLVNKSQRKSLQLLGRKQKINKGFDLKFAENAVNWLMEFF